MVRLGDPSMTAESKADQLDRYGQHVLDVVAELGSRAGQVALFSGESGQLVRNMTDSETLCNLDEWEASYMHGEKISWTKFGMGGHGKPPDPNKGFLVESQEDAEGGRGGVFVAPSSLREVESEIHVYLLNSATNPAQGRGR